MMMMMMMRDWRVLFVLCSPAAASLSSYPVAKVRSPPPNDEQDRRWLEQPSPEDSEFPDLSCDVELDFCETPFNGVCDRSTSISENCNHAHADCFDCDECRQFGADCESCLQHNCFWCPGDATCYNSDLYQILNRITSCPRSSDYTQDMNTCRGDTLDGGFFLQDPLFPAQKWVYDMIQVVPVWQMGYSGQGIRVRVNDNGVDSSHPEFQDRFDVGTSCSNYLPRTQNSDISSSQVMPIPSPSSGDPAHGTSVAGIVGAAANNGICSAGIAPNVTLSGCNVFVSQQTPEPYEFIADQFQLDPYDIASNSFGETACRSRRPGRRGRRLQEDCPFQVLPAVGRSPCDICAQEEVNRGVTITLSAVCESAIIQHCQRFFAQDSKACLEFLDLFVEECHYSVLPVAVQEGLTQAITEGRQGKGVVFVSAAGNSLWRGGDTNLSGWSMSRLVMTVGAVDENGRHATYSNPGSSLFVVGPGGDHQFASSHLTTGLDGTCRDTGVGTSFSTPVVSGVVALMLEANPELTWRDVQEIIARTSVLPSQRAIEEKNDDSANINVAGFWHSNFYGFGIINAQRAVQLALEWSPVPPEAMLVEESGEINLPILDDANAPTITTIAMTTSDDSQRFRMQSVSVLLDLEHFSRGHLEIVLTSPQGTRSVLHPGKRPENRQISASERWKLMTVRNWGEDPVGDWTLELIDLIPGDVSTECVNADWFIDRTNFPTRSESPLDPLDCFFIEGVGACVDGAVDPFGRWSLQQLNALLIDAKDANGRSAMEACCACGGSGVAREDVTDQLRQWTLVVHGYYDENDGGSQQAIRTLSPTWSPQQAQMTDSPTQISPESSTNGGEGNTLANLRSPQPSSQPALSPETSVPVTPEEPGQGGGGGGILQIFSAGSNEKRHSWIPLLTSLLIGRFLLLQ